MTIEPGTVLQSDKGNRVTISHRKADDTGWWNTDGSGFADFVLERMEGWTVLCPTCLRPAAPEGEKP